MVGLSPGSVLATVEPALWPCPRCCQSSCANRLKRWHWVILGEVQPGLNRPRGCRSRGWRHIHRSPGAWSQGQTELGTSGSPGHPGPVS